MSKNLKLGLVLIALILVSIALFFVENKSISRSFDQDVFTIVDTASIEGIRIDKQGVDIRRTNDGKSWLLNDSLAIDPSLIDILFVIMSQVQVQRPVSTLNLEEIKRDLIDKGKKVVFNLGDKTLTLYTGGNASKTKSYFANEDLNEVFIVEIPGYNNYLSGIFELTKGQWRSRRLFNSNWRSLQVLEIDYEVGDDLNIRFKDRFFEVEGVSQPDSTLLADYINQFENFKLNDYLEAGNHSRYDSLLSTKEIALLRIQDIDVSKNKTFKVYPIIRGENFYLLVDAQEQMIVIDQKRVERILKRPQDFLVQEYD